MTNLDLLKSIINEYNTWYKEIDIKKVFNKGRLPVHLIKSIRYNDVEDVTDDTVNKLIVGLGKMKIKVEGQMDKFIERINNERKNS